MVREIINKVKKIINNLARPGENLSESVVRGGFWVFSLRIVQQLFSLARLVILARILAPHDFGLMGIALLTMATLETFSQTGFQQALIQKKEDIKSYLDSAWTVLILRGFILFAILYLIAPYAATLFDSPESKSIIQVIGFSILLQAFINIGVVYFKKELEFNKQFIYELSGTLTDLIVAVSAALILKSVWALVFGLLAGSFARFIVSYFIHPYRPHFSSDLGKAKELFGFGKWVLGSSILIFLITQGDDIFVGKLLGVAALGFYQMAYRISNIPATEITHVISQVTFPAYSKLQDNIPKLREAYLKVLQVTAFLSFPIAGLIFVLGHDFTRIFLGEKWMPMVPALQILSFYGLFRSFGALSGNAITAIGKVFILPRIPIIQLIFIAILIYPMAVKFELIGVSATVTLSVILAVLYSLKIGNKYLSIKSTVLLRLLLPSIISATLMVITVGIANYLLYTSFFLLIIEGVGGILIYILLLATITKQNLFIIFCKRIQEYVSIVEAVEK